jgi:hypothetical protein
MELKIDPFITDKTLVFTVTSDGYKYYTWNLYKILQTLKIPWKLCILCLDRESNDFFNRIAQIPSRLYLMPGDRVMHKEPVRFGTTPFKRMNRMKLKALQELSQRPELDTLIFIDSDIAVFKDFVPYLKDALQTNPLLFQCDENISGSFECSNTLQCSNPCTGVIAMLLNSETRSNLKELYKIVSEQWGPALTDQDYITNRLLSIGLSYATLSRPEFPNGIFLANNKYKEGNPYLVHFNYIVGKAKQAKMIEKECWALPEYV